jgi:hypothetical protein
MRKDTATSRPTKKKPRRDPELEDNNDAAKPLMHEESSATERNAAELSAACATLQPDAGNADARLLRNAMQ